MDGNLGLSKEFIANLEKKLHYSLDDLYYDETNEFDIKFGANYNDTQGKTAYKTDANKAKSPELRKLAELICIEAITNQATDIRILKVNEDLGIVRLRKGTEMIPYRKLHGGSLDALAVVFKDFANANIEEKFNGQAGRFTIKVDGVKYDIRASFMPTVFGENISLRLLYSQNLESDISKLGLPEYVLNSFNTVLNLSEGLILLTGGTGSGKTTTMYTGINQIMANSNGTKNVITIENPVEYIIEGAVQSQVNNLRGYTFAKGLQTALRQNPDIILVGEINDSETAQTAVRASTSGHLVFSTLHTNDVLSVAQAMEHYGVNSLQLSWALQLVINQKLENKLCPHCRIQKLTLPEEMAWINSLGMSRHLINVFKRNPDGCDKCNYYGYYGRVLICSMLDANDTYTRLAMENLPLVQLENQLINDDSARYYTLKQDVFRHLEAGTIDLITAKSILR